MAWGRIDDGFHDHPKVENLSLAAVGLWTLNFTWAHRHRRTSPVPGFIPAGRVTKLAGKQTRSLVAELTAPMPGKAHGLWEPVDGGWLIHDFEHYLPKRRDPDEAAEAGRKGAHKRWQPDSNDIANSHHVSHATANDPIANPIAVDSSRASARASPSRPVPTTPVTTQGGQRHEPLPAADATSSPPKCSKHPNGDHDGPCAGCARVREHDQRIEAQAAETRRRAIEECPHCDGTSWIVDPDTGDSTKCNHRPAA